MYIGIHIKPSLFMISNGVEINYYKSKMKEINRNVISFRSVFCTYEDVNLDDNNIER